jgi:FG-GAP repeat
MLQADDEFGISVSISGDAVVVGAPRHMLAILQQGVAYVFVKPSAGWSNMTETAKLSAPDAQQIAYFGYSVAVSGNAILVGSPEQTIDGIDSRGAAYIFAEPKTGWATSSQSAVEFTAPNTSELGWTVALDLGTAVASAPGNGVAFLYAKPPDGWSHATLTAELTTSTPDFQDFGAFTAMRNETICIGATAADSGIGAAYVYQEPIGGWQNMTQTAILTPSDGVLGEAFGVSVSVSNSTIAVGADYEGGGQGAVYLYSKPIDGWQNATENQKILPPSGQFDFGHSVLLNYSMLFIGADTSSDVWVY